MKLDDAMPTKHLLRTRVRADQIYRLMWDTLRTDQRLPTLSEIAAHFGYANGRPNRGGCPSVVRMHLDILAKAGLIERWGKGRYRLRGVRVVLVTEGP